MLNYNARSYNIFESTNRVFPIVFRLKMPAVIRLTPNNNFFLYFVIKKFDWAGSENKEPDQAGKKLI